MDIKRSYYEDIRLFASGSEIFWMAALVASLAIFPWIAPSYTIYSANYIAIMVMVTVGLNLLVGYTGQISLGHAGFFAIGAYGTVSILQHWNLPFFVALFLAALVSALFGLLIGLPALRLEGPYLSIATLAFGLTITEVIGKLTIFGERQGLHTPPLKIGPWLIKTDAQFYYLVIPLTFVMTLMARNLTRTRVGRAFVAIRDADIAAAAMGINLMRYKTLAFALSAFYAGVAGGLFAFSLRFIEPELFNLYLSILFLAMVVVGGIGSIAGSIAGACLLAWLDLELRNILDLPLLGPWLKELSQTYFSFTGISNISFIVYGLIMVLIMIFEPLGLYGFWIRTKKYWRTWPF